MSLYDFVGRIFRFGLNAGGVGAAALVAASAIYWLTTLRMLTG